MARRSLSVMMFALSLAACGRAPDAARMGGAGHEACRPADPVARDGLGSRDDGMQLIAGGAFLMGAAPMREEEGPPRRTTVGSFWIDQTEITNREFSEFVRATGHVTGAERSLDPARYRGLSPEQLKPSGIVFVGLEDQRGAAMGGWLVVPGADWRHPAGPHTSIAGREDHPVVQISWEDATAYAHWRGNELPTEAEWEYAARGGLDGAPYVWGEATPDGPQQRANTWQGIFPIQDTGEDGYKAQTAPVGCFSANGFGLYDMAGNVWEWTSDWYAPGLNPQDRHFPAGPDMGQAFDPGEPAAPKHVIKGGSFLCAENYCLRYRPPARQAGPTDSGSTHIGFRTIRRVAQ